MPPWRDASRAESSVLIVDEDAKDGFVCPDDSGSSSATPKSSWSAANTALHSRLRSSNGSCVRFPMSANSSVSRSVVVYWTHVSISALANSVL